jgi:hypothetical protein
MVFRASLDGVAKVFSTVFTLLLLGVVLWQVYLYIDSPQLNSIIASTILLAILFVPYYHHPFRYYIDSGQVTIQRPFRSVRINKRKIEHVRVVQPQEMKDTLRNFGVAGLYGYFGRFSNRNLGSMLWYATQRKNYVLIQTQDKNYILTPDNPHEFVRLLNLK